MTTDIPTFTRTAAAMVAANDARRAARRRLVRVLRRKAARQPVPEQRGMVRR